MFDAAAKWPIDRQFPLGSWQPGSGLGELEPLRAALKQVRLVGIDPQHAAASLRALRTTATS